MFGAIYIGLSGLNAYSRGLQQISNNVSNLNSSGFKATTVSFTDLFGVGSHGGLSFSNGTGGNSGSGVNVNPPQLDFRQGDLRQTDRDLDLAVDGNGFLVLMKGDEILYTRTGSFEVDKDGFIVLVGTEFRLATLDSAGKAVSLSIDASRTHPPQETKSVKFSNNLSRDYPIDNPDFPPPTLGNIKVFDAKGGSHVWQARFERKGVPPDEWNVIVTDDKSRAIGTKTLKFNGAGIVDPETKTLVFEDSDNGLSVTFDFSTATQFGSGTIVSLSAAPADGFGTGSLKSVSINEKGELELAYSNDQKKSLGPIAVADFRDPQALEQRSGGLFAETVSAGRELLPSQDEKVGRVLGRRLEASNVDLAKQFGDLIVIQRGFQASSQIISVSNDMIQQLFGIRGQG